MPAIVYMNATYLGQQIGISGTEGIQTRGVALLENH
jgi:hypothetical protein